MRLVRAAAGFANGKGISDDFILSLEAGADINFAEPDTGLTSLHYAAAYDKIELVRLIARQPQCDFTIADHAGRTAATLAYEVAENSVTGRFLLTKEMRQRRNRQSSAKSPAKA
jgi:ankyrin repeat protein